MSVPVRFTTIFVGLLLSLIAAFAVVAAVDAGTTRHAALPASDGLIWDDEPIAPSA